MRKPGILMLAVAAVLLVACGGPKEDPKDKPPAPQTEEAGKDSSGMDVMKPAGEPSSSGGDTATGISEVPKVKPAYPEERTSTPESPEATQMPEEPPEKQKPGEPPSDTDDEKKDGEPGSQ